MDSSLTVTVDIEPTNRCNAKCHFCPRDQTPHQGLMTQAVFDQTMARVVELGQVNASGFQQQLKISLCGLGEPLLNPKTPGFVRQIRELGLECVMSSNAALLDERRGAALLDAGLQQININVGDRDDDYEQVYKLPFHKTRDNVLRFAEMAKGRCEVHIVLVDFRRDREHIKKMVHYWRDLGLENFVFFDIMNRGGALFVDHMQFEAYPELAEAQAMLDAKGGDAFCGAPFVFLFVGYNGQYYLCCSDWKKEVPLGSVFDKSFRSVTLQKLDHVMNRESICKTCNWDPLNRLTEELRAVNAGESDTGKADALADQLIGLSRTLSDAIQNSPDLQAFAPKKRIPVTAV